MASENIGEPKHICRAVGQENLVGLLWNHYARRLFSRGKYGRDYPVMTVAVPALGVRQELMR